VIKLDTRECLLEGIGITKYFGGLAAVKNFTFKIYQGEIVGLIGPNGAGKTTVFNLITRIYRPDAGKILFLGKDLTKLSPYQICHLGIARTFQITRIFNEMTALENACIGGLFGKRKPYEVAKKDAMKYLDMVGLQDKDVCVRKLTLFDKKKVELAASLNAEPKLLLIDEFVAGISEAEVEDASRLINEIRQKLGITVFWIEHVMRAIMNVADRIIAIHYGEKIAEGAPKEIAYNKDVISAYLGKDYIKEDVNSAKSK
jgi:branched-chain amino acid transport system ATP-binding protein